MSEQQQTKEGQVSLQTDEKSQLLEVLKLYITESNVLETLLLKCFNTNSQQSQDQDSQMGVLLQEIDKRKQSLSAIQRLIKLQEQKESISSQQLHMQQSSIEIKNVSESQEQPHLIDVSNKKSHCNTESSQQNQSVQDYKKVEEKSKQESPPKILKKHAFRPSKENVSQTRRTQIIQSITPSKQKVTVKQMNPQIKQSLEFLTLRMQTSFQNANNKITSALKKLQVKHLNDLLPIKKPSLFSQRSCQLMCQLLYSFKKEFEINNREAYLFVEWHDIVRFLSQSPRVYQDIQHIKSKIENLEYNFKFIMLLKGEYLKSEKLLNNSNKQQTSECCGLIFQVFIGVIEYIQVIEDLRKQNKLEDFKHFFRIKSDNKTSQSVLRSSLTPQFLRKRQQQQDKSRSRSPLDVFKTNASAVRSNSNLNKSGNHTLNKSINENKDGNISGRSSIFSNKSSQNLKRSTSQFLVKKNSVISIKKQQFDSSINRGKLTDRSTDRASITPSYTSQKQEQPPSERKQKSLSPTKRLINMHKHKIVQHNKQVVDQKKSSEKKRSSSKKSQIVERVNNFKIQLRNIDEGNTNNDENNSIYNIREKHISQLNIDFSFCSDGNSVNQGPTKSYSDIGGQVDPSPKDFASGIQHASVNMFFNHINQEMDSDEEMETRPLFKLEHQHDENDILRLRQKGSSGIDHSQNHGFHTINISNKDQQTNQYLNQRMKEYDKILDGIKSNQKNNEVLMEDASKKFIGDNYYKQKSIQDSMIERIEKELFSCKFLAQQNFTNKQQSQ